MSGSDARALSRSLLDLCRMRKLTIATAESCTGGLVAGAIGAVAGTLAGSAVRGALARVAGKDLPVALLEDFVAILGAIFIVSRV